MKFLIKISLIFMVFIPLSSCGQQSNETMESQTLIKNSNIETATFGAGCFWCVEAVFDQLTGVISAESGYSGGNTVNPSYEEVCTGQTGHAEVVNITYDPAVISFVELLEVFWKTHDPTTLNRQGADVGTQYRSAIFYHNEEQKKVAEELKSELNSADIWSDPIVTEITAFKAFYRAEEYHQEYYVNNMNKPYCSLVITPKIKKFHDLFSDKLKKD
jgi:peptide-methionine (S)-S-oxide reductase